MTFHAAFERMQSEARKVHSFRTVTSVQCGQDTLEKGPTLHRLKAVDSTCD